MTDKHFSIRGKIAVITGAGDGIGKAIAIKFASEGCSLALIDINSVKINSVCNSLQSLFPTLTIKPFICDMSNEQKVYELVNSIQSTFNTNAIQILVNNVGIAGTGSTVINGNIRNLKKMMDINLWSMIYGTRAFKKMLISNSKDNKCYIINTGSIASIETGFSMYSITKHAVIAFSETIMEEFKRGYPKLNILISTLVPGFIDTNLTKSSAKQLGFNDKQINGLQKVFQQTKQGKMIKMTRINDPMIVANLTFEAMKQNKTVIPTHFDWHEAVIKDRMNALLTGKKDNKSLMRKAVRKRMANYKQKQSKL
eukprot:126722_1